MQVQIMENASTDIVSTENESADNASTEMQEQT